jgi:hypothetical protein
MKRPKLSNKFPCQCGHSRKLHGFAGPPIGDWWCDGVIHRTKNIEYLCDCECYVPDNLKYLEQESKKKRKDK